jgi:hypothetical protein
MWPLIIATDDGGCLRNIWSERPGKLGRKPFCKACSKVDRAGENNAACAKATNSAGVADPMAPSADWWEGGKVGLAGGSSMCHSLVAGVRYPTRTVHSLYAMVTSDAVKETVQSASQNWPMDRSDDGVKAGTMCTCRAAGGRAGQSSSASCVDVMTVPLGVRMAMGWAVGRMLTTGAFTVQKCAVLPVSAMAVKSVRVSEGGPTAIGSIIEDNRAQVGVNDEFSILLSTGIDAAVGFPHPQLPALVRVAPWWPACMMILLPPIILVAVASS